MNKTEENLKRIRAHDAEQWRTIKGSHVLIGEDGTVKAGAGGKFNGQKFGTKGTGTSKTQAMKNLASAANPGGSGFNYKSHPQYKQGLEHATKFWEHGPGTEAERFTSAIAEADEKLKKWNGLLKKNPDGPGSEVSKRNIAWYNGAREAHVKALQEFKAKSESDKSKTQTIKNLASAASPESKNDSKKAWVKYDSNGMAIIDPKVKKEVNEDLERNKKKFPNQSEAELKTLKKYSDKARAYLDKGMFDKYAYEEAKVKCLSKQIHDRKYPMQNAWLEKIRTHAMENPASATSSESENDPSSKNEKRFKTHEFVRYLFERGEKFNAHKRDAAENVCKYINEKMTDASDEEIKDFVHGLLHNIFHIRRDDMNYFLKKRTKK